MDIIPVSHAEVQDGVCCTVALGFFDGMHRGHTALLEKTVALAAENGSIPAVFTFADDDRLKRGEGRLMREEERLSAFSRLGIRRVYLGDFSHLCGLSPTEFAEQILLGTCTAKHAVCGFNFHFGHGAAADATVLSSLLATHGVPLTVLPPMMEADAPISASRIRAAIRAGEMENAAAMLGRPYSLTGTVLHGKELGRRLGFPTANLPFFRNAAIPAAGVYAARVYGEGLDAPVFGVANVGVRPTVESTDAVNCEVHLFGEPPTLYEKTLTVELLTHLRGEKRFADQNELSVQIKRDTERAKEYCKTWNGSN